MITRLFILGSAVGRATALAPVTQGINIAIANTKSIKLFPTQRELKGL